MPPRASLEDRIQVFFEAASPSEIEEPLRPLFAKSRRLGVDVRVHSAALLKVAAASDELAVESRRCFQALAFKALVMAILSLSVRLVMSRLLDEPRTLVLWDRLFVLGSSSVVLIILALFYRARPKSWTHAGDRQDVSPFFRWCHVLLLDEWSSSTHLGHNPSEKSWKTLIQRLTFLQKLERKDGICRKELRSLATVNWSDRELSVTRVQLRRHVALLPVTELLLATLLAVGFCGLTAVDFLRSDATMEQIFEGDAP